jgi:flagellar hook-associated protein 1
VSFVGLYTGLTGVRAAQTGIDITGHNVANATTPGYTRQRVELTARPVYQSLAGPVGTGVDVTSIGRLRDSFLDTRFRSAVADFAASSTQADLLGRLEALTGEPDDGISARMGRLWEATESWANDPAGLATRRQVLAELTSVAEAIRSVAVAWDQLEADTVARRDTLVGVVNDTLDSLADLDRRIATAEPNRVGPDLLDQRDLLLDDLARLTGATVSYDQSGRARVELGGQPLLAGGVHQHLAVGTADDGSTTFHVVVPGADPASEPGPSVAVGGELGGLHAVLDDHLPRLRGELDAFAEAFADAFNDVNGQGHVAGGGTGGGLLWFEGGAVDARNLRVTTDIAALAAAGDGAAAPHDATNAERFGRLRLDGVGGGGSLENRLADLIVGLASDVRSAKATANGARAVSVGAELARVSEHGVSIDEEMVSLVRYQRALEAASRVMTTVDEALEVLVNRTGIVGR